MSNKELTGQCKFCNQVHINENANYETIEQANECATLHCNCYEAKKYAAQKKAEADRKAAIERAKELIENLFGEGAESYGLLPVNTLAQELMLTCAVMIYDNKIKDVSINVTSCLKVKISKSAKGKLTFTRSDAAAVKQEV